MVKPWSISTTVRNPERIRDFLKILKTMEGEGWSRTNQKKFQILLIQHKFYGYGIGREDLEKEEEIKKEIKKEIKTIKRERKKKRFCKLLRAKARSVLI